MKKYITYEAALNVPRPNGDSADWHSCFLDYPEYKETDREDLLVEYKGETYADYPLAIRDIFLKQGSMRFARNSLEDHIDEEDIQKLYELVREDILNGIYYTDIRTLIRTFGKRTETDWRSGIYDEFIRETD